MTFRCESEAITRYNVPMSNERSDVLVHWCALSTDNQLLFSESKQMRGRALSMGTTVQVEYK